MTCVFCPIFSKAQTLQLHDLKGENDAETPLEAAASRGNVVVMQMLLDAKANLSRQSSSGSTALVAGVLNCQSEAVKFLLEHGVDPNSLTKPSKGSRLAAVWFECSIFLGRCLFEDKSK